MPGTEQFRNPDEQYFEVTSSRHIPGGRIMPYLRHFSRKRVIQRDNPLFIKVDFVYDTLLEIAKVAEVRHDSSP